MGNLTSSEQAAVERAGAEPMLDQVLAWSAVNSGSRNLDGLGRMAGLLADAFAALPGDVLFEPPGEVEAVDEAGRASSIAPATAMATRTAWIPSCVAWSASQPP